MPSAEQTLNTKNTLVAPSRLSRLPIWLSHWLGHRHSTDSELPNYLIWLWSFIGAFCGLSVIQAVFGQAQYFIKRGAPQIVPSYGASAVLVFGAIEAPLAQPRALMAGHFIGALVGVCLTKLFLLLPTEERFEQLSWLAASLSCAIAIVAMQITATSHPPAGATAILPAVDGGIRAMGWYYLPVILLTSTLSLVVALLIDNIQRRYPVYWFKPAKPSPAPPVRVDETTTVQSSAITLPVGVDSHVAVDSVGGYPVNVVDHCV